MIDYDPMAWEKSNRALGGPIDWSRSERKNLVEWIHVANPKTLLEVGCCQGQLYEHLHERQGWWRGEYTGVDITPTYVDACKSRFPNARFELGDVRALAFKDKSFDCVVCSDVLMHLPDVGAALIELCRVASRYLIISTWAATRYKSAHSQGFLNHWWPERVITGWLEGLGWSWCSTWFGDSLQLRAVRP